MEKKNKRWIISSAAVLMIMIIIFNFSSQNGTGSSEISTKVTRVICRIIFFDYEHMTAEQQMFVVTHLHSFVRKLAHFAVYMMLGVFSYAAILPYKKELKKPAFLALAVCAVYAVCDEIHQHFVPGRSMRIRDMILDSVGSLFGIIILSILIILFKHIKEECIICRKK